MKLANRQRGLKSKRHGQGFEESFVKLARQQSVGVTEIKQGCRPLRRVRGAIFQALLLKSPFDLCLHFDGRTAFIDLKTRETKSLCYSSIDQEQVRSLRVAAQGGIAGYVVRLPEGIVFFPIDLLESVKPGSSLSLEHGWILGRREGAICWFNVRRIFESSR